MKINPKAGEISCFNDLITLGSEKTFGRNELVHHGGLICFSQRVEEIK
jgi:hypothetical protein